MSIVLIPTMVRVQLRTGAALEGLRGAPLLAEALLPLRLAGALR
jgi:hypothetical protein